MTSGIIYAMLVVRALLSFSHLLGTFSTVLQFVYGR